MFNLYTKVILGKAEKNSFKSIEAIRDAFKKDNRKFFKVDLGARNDREVSISSIAKYGISSPSLCRLLFRISAHFKTDRIIELGTSLGISTAYLHLSNEKAKLISIEGDPELYKIAKSHLSASVHLINDDFEAVLKNEISKDKNSTLYYIDGNHQSAALDKYLEIIKTNLKENDVIILDDIYWSRDMMNAWKSATQDDSFGISIDLYKIGLLFPRQKQPKQHFILRP